MTVLHYCQELKEYFALRKIPESQWLLLVGEGFPVESDTARWWRESKSDCIDFPDFIKMLDAYEGNEESNDKLMHALFQKRQKPDEPFETFAWDVCTLYRKINKSVDLADIISRILNSCLSELSVFLRHWNYRDISELNRRAREVIYDMNKVRRLKREPLLRARQSDPILKYDNTQYKPRTWNNSYKHNSPQATQNNTNPPTQTANVSHNSNLQNDFHSNQNSQKQVHKSNNSNYTTQNSNSDKTDKNTSQKYTQKFKKQCQFCARFGHVEEECFQKARELSLTHMQSDKSAPSTSTATHASNKNNTKN